LIRNARHTEMGVERVPPARQHHQYPLLSHSFCVPLTGKFAVPTQDVLRPTHARTAAVLRPLYAGRSTRFSLASAMSSPSTSVYLLQELTIPSYNAGIRPLLFWFPRCRTFAPTIEQFYLPQCAPLRSRRPITATALLHQASLSTASFSLAASPTERQPLPSSFLSSSVPS
jgi:hypothetical protein